MRPSRGGPIDDNIDDRLDTLYEEITRQSTNQLANRSVIGTSITVDGGNIETEEGRRLRRVQVISTEVEVVVVAELAQHRPRRFVPAALDEQTVQEEES